ncbi:hypothetical protein D3C73_967350 [compost metagenome]
MLGHHGGVAAKAVAGQDQHLAADHVNGPVGPFAAHGGDAAAVVSTAVVPVAAVPVAAVPTAVVPVAAYPARIFNPDFSGQRARQQMRTRARGGAFQRGHQGHARTLRQGVHAARAVARVEKAVQHVESQAMARQHVHGRGRRAGIGGDQMRRGRAVGLGLDVSGETRRVISDAGRALHGRPCRRNKPRRQRRRAAGRGVALDQYGFDAGLRQPQRGGQSAGARADDQHRHLHHVGVRGAARGGAGGGAGGGARGAASVATGVAPLHDSRAHDASLPMKSAHVITSATVRRSASAASCMAGVGAAQPSASTVT